MEHEYEIADLMALDLLLDGETVGSSRLIALREHVEEQCQRCANTSYQFFDGVLECDNCGLGKGEEPPGC